MPAFRAHSADEIAHARTLYEETDLSPHDIAKILGIGTNTFYRRVKSWGWRRRRLRVEEVEAAAVRAAGSRDRALRRLGKKVLDERRAAIDRAEDAIVGQLDALEMMQARVAAAAMTVLQGEKAARTLRLLTQTLVEVGRYRSEAAELSAGKRRRAESEEVDLEAAREALRGKIAALCARERGE